MHLFPAIRATVGILLVVPFLWDAEYSSSKVRLRVGRIRVRRTFQSWPLQHPVLLPAAAEITILTF